MFGGSLTCESTKGVGSTFRLTVRLRISDRPVETKPAMPSENTSMASAPSAPLSTSASEPVTLSSSDSSGVASERPKVLLAEDNQVNQLITQKMLRRIGYDCDIANNGGEAVQKLNSHPFDYYAAVLMDLQMPDVDGRTAVIQPARILATTRCRSLLTGESVREVILDVLSCVGWTTLHKPVDLKTFGRRAKASDSRKALWPRRSVPRFRKRRPIPRQPFRNPRRRETSQLVIEASVPDG